MTPTTPALSTRSATPSLARGLSILALCAALTGGFLAQVWSAPAPAPAAAPEMANAPAATCSAC